MLVVGLASARGEERLKENELAPVQLGTVAYEAGKARLTIIEVRPISVTIQNAETKGLEIATVASETKRQPLVEEAVFFDRLGVEIKREDALKRLGATPVPALLFDLHKRTGKRPTFPHKDKFSALLSDSALIVGVPADQSRESAIRGDAAPLFVPPKIQGEADTSPGIGGPPRPAPAKPLRRF